MSWKYLDFFLELITVMTIDGVDCWYKLLCLHHAQNTAVHFDFIDD
jgi:hypothetical protein